MQAKCLSVQWRSPTCSQRQANNPRFVCMTRNNLKEKEHVKRTESRKLDKILSGFCSFVSPPYDYFKFIMEENNYIMKKKHYPKSR